MRRLTYLTTFLLAAAVGSSTVAQVLQVTNNQGVGPTFDLDPATTYTHKLDFPNDGMTTPTNGVPFSSVGLGPSVDPITGNGFSLSIPNLGTFNSGSSAMIDDFYYNSGGGNSGDVETLTLSGLTPGQVYETRLYYRPFGARPNTVTVDTGGATPWVGTLDQATSDAENYAAVRYRAESNTATMHFAQHLGNASWHQYGVTNQVASALGPGDTANILGLYPTGVDDNGAPLSPSDADPHYAFVSGPQASATNPQATVQTNHPAWSANDGGSQWIGVTSAGTNSVAVGTYAYELSFDVPSNAVLSTVMIDGLWWADNDGADTNILVNGVDTGLSGTAPFNSPTGTAFSIVDGMNGISFLHGENTLTFEVFNGGTSPNPHGLRVANLSGSFVIAPEPASVAMWLALATAGLTSGLACQRRRKRATQ